MTTTAYIYTMTRIGQVGAWSEYVFPFDVQDWALAGDTLFLRSGDTVYRVDDQVAGDEVLLYDEEAAEYRWQIAPAPGVLQWAWLDWGSPGTTKMLQAFEVVGTANVAVSFGFDQRLREQFTPPWTVPGDTVPGMPIPMPLAAPSLAVRLEYAGDVPWTWMGLQLYLQPMRGGT